MYSDIVSLRRVAETNLENYQDPPTGSSSEVPTSSPVGPCLAPLKVIIPQSPVPDTTPDGD